MRRFSDRQGLHTVTELNVTPLLDLAFVLLIIFMITTPLMENSVDLVIPSSAAASQPVDPSTVQNLSINRDEVIQFNGQVTTLAQLEIDLKALKAKNPAMAIVIRSDRELPVQRLIDLMDCVQRAKISKVGVVTNPEK